MAKIVHVLLLAAFAAWAQAGSPTALMRRVKKTSKGTELTPDEHYPHVPETIFQLAVSVLGAEAAAQLAQQATTFNKTLAGHSFKFWTRATDESRAAVGWEFGGKACTGECATYKYGQLQGKEGLAVDVGANIGDTSLLALAFNPKLQVVSLEASPQTYVFLKWNLLENNIPEITLDDIKSGSGKPGILAMHAAVTGDGKPVMFKWSPERSYNAQMQSKMVSMGGEFEHHDYPNLKWTTATVPGLSLAEWFTKNQLPKPVWLKMDCEGCEYDSLLGLEKSGILEEAHVVGEAHARWLQDSCKGNLERADCQAGAAALKDTKELMCKKYSFVGCDRVMKCGLLVDNC